MAQAHAAATSKEDENKPSLRSIDSDSHTEGRQPLPVSDQPRYVCVMLLQVIVCTYLRSSCRLASCRLQWLFPCYTRLALLGIVPHSRLTLADPTKDPQLVLTSSPADLQAGW